MVTARVTLKLDTITGEQLGQVLAACSRTRDDLARWYDWRPRVNVCGTGDNGVALFAVETDPIPLAAAAEVLGALAFDAAARPALEVAS